MKTPEIEKTLIELSNKFLYNEGYANLLLLAMSAAKRNFEDKTSLCLPQELTDLRKRTDDIIINLEELLEPDNVQAAVDNVGKIHGELIELYRSIYFYKDEWGILSMAFNDETFIRKYRENPPAVGNINYSMFFGDCTEFLESARDIHELREFASQLLKCMPMRMSRPKFFDLVERSVSADLEGASEDIVIKTLETLKCSCTPTLQENFGKIMPDVAQWLTDKAGINPARLDDEQLAAEYDDFGIMLDTITEIEDCFAEVYEDLNSILILLYIGFSFDGLTESYPDFADLFHAAIDIISGEADDAEAIAETLTEQLEDAIAPLIDKSLDISKKTAELMSKIEDPSILSEDAHNSLHIQNTVASIYFGTLSDEIYNFEADMNSPVATAEFRKNALKGFTEYLSEHLAGLPTYLRKSKMTALLGSIPVCMDIPDILDYVKSSIENCIGDEQKILILDKTGYVFSANGMDFEEEEEEYEHHHDHHCHDHCCHDH